MTAAPLARRRFLAVAAAAAGLAALPAAARAATPLRVWRGTALGAEASLRFRHPDPAEADRLVADCLAEIARLERVFSLYRADSALSRLNRDGSLADPPADLVRLLGLALDFGRLSAGAFDVTVQPLWQLYAGHFARADADPAGPPAAAVAAVRRLVDFRALRVTPDRIAFAAPGMAVTLNGIAQGYVTDRVASLLRGRGLDRVLVDLGEIRALGPHPDGRPWRVGLRDPLDGSRSAGTLDLAEGAVATSSGLGTVFDAAGRFTHLFDPATGGCAARWRAVTVEAAEAATADALSTALAVMPAAAARALLAAVPGARARAIDGQGQSAVL